VAPGENRAHLSQGKVLDAQAPRGIFSEGPPRRTYYPSSASPQSPPEAKPHAHPFVLRRGTPHTIVRGPFRRGGNLWFRFRFGRRFTIYVGRFRVGRGVPNPFFAGEKPRSKKKFSAPRRFRETPTVRSFRGGVRGRDQPQCKWVWCRPRIPGVEEQRPALGRPLS